MYEPKLPIMYEPKLPIKPSTACRLKWTGRDGKMYKYRRRGNPTLTITVTSYVGTIAFGAMHWYGRVNGALPSTYCVEDNSWLTMGGYGYEKPELYSVFEYDAKRQLNAPEKDMNGDLVGDTGDKTGRFLTAEDAFEAAVRLARETFADNKNRHWVVRFEYCGSQLEDDYRLSDLDDIKALMKKFEWGL